MSTSTNERFEFLSEFSGVEEQTKPAQMNGDPSVVVPPEKIFSKEDIERARADEKKKLYHRLETSEEAAKAEREKAKVLDAQLGEMKSRLTEIERSQLPDDQRVRAEMEDLRRRSIEAQSEQERWKKQHDEAVQQASLNDYKWKRMNQLQQEGVGFFDHLIMGDTPEKIEESIQLSRAEYLHQKEKLQKELFLTPEYQAAQAAYVREQQRLQEMQHQQSQPQYQPPTQEQVMAQQMATAFAPQPMHQQVQGPTAASPAPVPQGPGADPNYIEQMTNQEAIRSGAYAQNRDVLMARIRQGHTGGVPQQLPMRPFPTAQAVATQAPTQQPGSQMPYAQMPNGVMQPQGLPTPPVMNPQLPQGGNMAMPSAGQVQHPTMSQPGYDPRATAPVYNQQPQQQYQQAPQPQHPVQLMQPPVAPTPQADASLRAMAAAAAASALSHPQHSASTAALTGPMPRVPGDYNFKATNPDAPSADILQRGHPMARNT